MYGWDVRLPGSHVPPTRVLWKKLLPVPDFFLILLPAGWTPKSTKGNPLEFKPSSCTYEFYTVSLERALKLQYFCLQYWSTSDERSQQAVSFLCEFWPSLTTIIIIERIRRRFRNDDFKFGMTIVLLFTGKNLCTNFGNFRDREFN